MQLMCYEDLKKHKPEGQTTENPERQKSECKMLFHFFFKMIRKKERSGLKNMDWNIDANPVQNLYLSEDTTLLMEVVNNFFATVYVRRNLDLNGKFKP